MVARGSVFKQERMGELRLERKILDRRDLLVLNRNLCNGCGICSDVCPKDSITYSPVVIEDGRLLRAPIMHIDEKTCIMCGMCSVFCPMGALEAWVNDENIAMFVKREAIPLIKRSISINQEMCISDCGLKCEKSCPRDAIKVFVQGDDKLVQKIVDIEIDAKRCIYCKACEFACPIGAVTVEKPFEGLITIDTKKCPQNCQVCVDICPSKALTLSEEGKIKASHELCIYCKACQRVCPKAAIHVSIDRILHTTITSATWITILEKLASFQAASKELIAKSYEKQKSIAKNRIY